LPVLETCKAKGVLANFQHDLVLHRLFQANSTGRIDWDCCDWQLCSTSFSPLGAHGFVRNTVEFVRLAPVFLLAIHRTVKGISAPRASFGRILCTTYIASYILVQIFRFDRHACIPRCCRGLSFPSSRPKSSDQQNLERRWEVQQRQRATFPSRWK
jgi:hypothetical protein